MFPSKTVLTWIHTLGLVQPTRSSSSWLQQKWRRLQRLENHDMLVVWTVGPNIWSNYSDLTRPHPWWFSKGNLLISGKSRLVMAGEILFHLAKKYDEAGKLVSITLPEASPKGNSSSNYPFSRAMLVSGRVDFPNLFLGWFKWPLQDWQTRGQKGHLISLNQDPMILITAGKIRLPIGAVFFGIQWISLFLNFPNCSSIITPLEKNKYNNPERIREVSARVCVCFFVVSYIFCLKHFYPCHLFCSGEKNHPVF